MTYNWTDNPTETGVAQYDPDVLNENLMHLKYDVVPTPRIPFAVNSSKTNVSGYADFTSKVDNTSVTILATDVDIVQTDVLGRTHTTTADYTITGISADGTYDVIQEFDVNTGVASNPVAINSAQQGKDLKVSFARGDATDDYGLHTPTVFGSPTFTDGRFNSNGATYLRYPISTLGTGKWCMQCKFKSTNTSTAQYILRGSSLYSVGVYKSNANKLTIIASSNNTSVDIANNISGTKSDWDVNTEYYMRLRFTGSQYLVDWSLTGLDGSWTNDITINSSSVIYSSLPDFLVGCEYNGTVNFIGTIDDVYVQVGNDTIVEKYSIREVNVLPASPETYNTYFTVYGVNPMKQYFANGTTLAQKVFNKLSGFVRTAGVIGTPYSYALNGAYKSSTIAIPSNNSITNFNSNIGVNNQTVSFDLICIVASDGYSLGDVIHNFTPMHTGGIDCNLANHSYNKNTATYFKGDQSLRIYSKSTGGAIVTSEANWRLRVTARRDF